MRRNLKNAILIMLSFILIFEFFIINTNAATSRNFKNLTIDNGLSQSDIYCMFQDSKGYMWIGTGDGLNKYNSHEFKVYRNIKGDKESLSNNAIIDIKEDAEGNIWVATVAGLNKIDVDTNKVKRYLPNEDGCNISNARIREILVTTENEIFVATNDGLNIYDKENDNFIRVGNSEGNLLSNQAIYTIVEDIYGDYWVGTAKGLNKIDKESGEIKKYFHDDNDENSISFNFIYNLYADNKGYLWVGTYYGGLNKFDIKTEKNEIFFPNEGSDSIPGAFIRDILRDSSGKVWVATDYGFTELNEDTGTFNTYKSIEYDKDSIISDDVYSICEDSSGMIWIGAMGGLSIFNPNNLFINYKNDPLNDNSISGKNISGIYEDKDGLLWIGTIYKGVNVLDRENNIIKRITSKSKNGEAISDNLIRTIVGIDNEIWIATQNGLNKYDKNTSVTTQFTETNGLIKNDILSLHIDNSGLLWIGTTNGLCTYNRENNTFTSFSDELKSIGIENTSISSIYQDKDGVIWFSAGRDYGLVKYDGKEFENFKFSNNELDNYSKIISINSSDNEYLWVGTDKGLIKIDKIEGEAELYTENDGLPNSCVYGVLFDDYGDLWLSTNYGISKYDLKENKFINFDFTDGIQANEFNEYSYYKNYKGEMFFGGIKGLTIFNPDNLKEKTFIPKVQIESIETNKGNLKIDEEIKLKYNENQLKFNFFMPDFSDPQKLTYGYKLVGFDKDFIFSGSNNHANYINLSPGKYKFEVIGRNSSGQWSEPTAVEINILKPMWKTPLAYILYIFICIVIVYIIWNRVKILDNLVKQKTYELNNKLLENERLYKILLKNEKNKNNYFINLSHELRTPLNLIVSTQQLVDKLNEDEKNIPKEKIKYYMSTINRNSNRLLSLIDNIIFTSKIEAGNYKLNIREHDIVYVVEEIALSMRDYIESKGIELIIEPEIEEKIIQCDASDIERVILNLISNATKFTSSGGKIEVKIYDLGSEVKIVVTDTGIGIDKSKHKIIFNRFDQAYSNTSEEYGGSGLGLTLSKQLVELHGGSISIESELGCGSSFIIILPVKQSVEIECVK